MMRRAHNPNGVVTVDCGEDRAFVGKNFSGNNQGKRRAADFYETPYSITRQFLEVEQFFGTVLEPACGNGAMIRVMRECGYDPVGYDIETDFLTETKPYDNVVTNPPYSLAHEFIIHAKVVARKKIAMLLPLSYLHGKRRYDEIYSDKHFALSRVYVLVRYPMLGDPLRDDGCYRTGMMVYAWYVWEKRVRCEPEIRWIDNHKYVIGSR